MVKIQQIEKLFFDILTYSYLLIFLIVLVFSNRNKKTDSLVMGGYGVLFFALSVLMDNVKLPPTYLKLYQSFYTLSEYAFFTFLLFRGITVRKFRIIILYLSSAFLLFLLYNFFWVKLSRLDSIQIGIETILILVYISLFLYQNFQITSDGFIYNNPRFWIAVGMLIYLGGTFFFNILLNYVDEKDIDQYWFLTYIADIVKNILFGASIIMYAYMSHKEKMHEPKHVPYLDLDMN